MGLIDRLDPSRHEHVRGRLRHNQIAWFTSVRADGQPECIPVWFLWRDDESILVYSQPASRKLTNLRTNAKVALVLDVSDLGRDNVRINGTAAVSDAEPSPSDNPAYLAKYAERIGALFGTPEKFAELFSVAVVVTPHRLFSPPPAPGAAY